MRTQLRTPRGLKKLTIMRCRFTVSEFIATTSLSQGARKRGEPGRGPLVIGDPGPRRLMVAENAEPLPVGKLLRDIALSRLRLQPERMAAQIDQLAARGVARMMEFRGEGGQRVAGVQVRGAGRVEIAGGRQSSLDRCGSSAGRSSTAPHSRQVRCSRLEKNREKMAGSCVSMS